MLTNNNSSTRPKSRSVVSSSREPRHMPRNTRLPNVKRSVFAAWPSPRVITMSQLKPSLPLSSVYVVSRTLHQSQERFFNFFDCFKSTMVSLSSWPRLLNKCFNWLSHTSHMVNQILRLFVNSFTREVTPRSTDRESHWATTSWLKTTWANLELFPSKIWYMKSTLLDPISRKPTNFFGPSNCPTPMVDLLTQSSDTLSKVVTLVTENKTSIVWSDAWTRLESPLEF